MKNRGFTLVELITTFALSAVIIVLLIGIINILKSLYSKTDVKTELYINQGSLSNVMNSKISNDNLLSYQACDDSSFCYNFIFKDGTTSKLIVTNNEIRFGEYTYRLDNKAKISSPTIRNEYVDIQDKNNDSSLLVIKIPITSDLYPDMDFGINLVYQGKISSYEASKAQSFSTDSWATIISSIRLGDTSKYKVGDTKTITLTGEDGISGDYLVRIANMSNEDSCGTVDFSETACGFVVEFVDIIGEHVMNTNNTSSGGWEDSEMRKYLNSTIYNALPLELQGAIKETKVISGYESGKYVNYTTYDKLYLLSTHEVYEEESLSTNDTAYNNTRQLDYYKGVNTDIYSSAKKQYHGSDISWWLRSADSGSTINSSFWFVHEGGGDHDSANRTYGVAPAFRLG